ncbi:MAG: hypothetical protein IH977_13970 [Nitrospinae bacterium]|nr:hypothetical protein [Nitrospinota bacterium]
MQPIIDFILDNKQWIFSGVGLFALSGALWFVRHLIFPNSPQNNEELAGQSKQRGSRSNGAPNILPKDWQGIVPPQSRYRVVTETSDSIPLGLQSFSFEYGPQGHAKPLTLKGAFVCAKIQFTCRISNPYKAMFGANEYALNVLPPQFLSQARSILEIYSFTKLRASRQEVSHEIMAKLSPQFEELGVQLESVTIGALDKIEPR